MNVRERNLIYSMCTALVDATWNTQVHKDTESSRNFVKHQKHKEFCWPHTLTTSAQVARPEIYRQNFAV